MPRLRSLCAAVILCVLPAAARATLPQAGSLIFGLSNSDATKTLELVSGPASMGGGTKLTSPWQSTPFLEVVKFDNNGGIAHNAQGNVLGVDFGTGAAGGQIFSLATTGVDPTPAGQLIIDTGTTNVTGMQIGGTVTQTRLGEIAVSPDNTKIVATGYDSGAVLVYDYAAGNTMGAGAAASNGRESAIGTLDPAHTQGVAWKNNSTALVFGATGTLYEVTGVSSGVPAVTAVKTVDTLADGNFTALAYNPSISPYIYASYGGFDTVAAMTLNKLYVIDPASSYNVVKTINLSTSINTARDMALDKSGNLFISQFGGTGTNGAAIDFIPAANILNPATLTDNSSIDWYQTATVASFSGLDIGFGPAGVAGDYNSDGVVDAADYIVWRKNLGSTTFTLPNRSTGITGAIGQSDYDFWKAHFGATSGAGSLGGGAVPEPSSGLLLTIGLATVAFARRRSG